VLILAILKKINFVLGKLNRSASERVQNSNRHFTARKKLREELVSKYFGLDQEQLDLALLQGLMYTGCQSIYIDHYKTIMNHLLIRVFLMVWQLLVPILIELDTPKKDVTKLLAIR
jgi:hypothetical protein